MLMNERQKRLIEVYDYLRQYHGIHTKTQFAEAIDFGRTSMSAALNGNEKYLTDSLFKNICAAYPGVFNLDYLLTGKGSLLISNENVSDKTTTINTTNPDVDWQKLALDTMKSQMADLRMQLVDKQNIIEAQQRTIELLNLQINGLKMEMQMKGMSTYPFTIGVAEKFSSPEK